MEYSTVLISLTLLALVVAIAAYKFRSNDVSPKNVSLSAAAAQDILRPAGESPGRSAPDDLAPSRATQDVSQADFGA